MVENGWHIILMSSWIEKIAVMDTVDARFTHEWLDNIENIIGSCQPDYLVIQHMEPDHSANIANFMNVYQNTKIVSTEKAFAMMRQFFGTDFEGRKIVVGEGDTLSLGKHNLTFVLAPMVHWPEVMVTYDSADKVLFSADGFWKIRRFGCRRGLGVRGSPLLHWDCGQVRRTGSESAEKGVWVDIQIICPLHGPVLTENLGYYLNLYQTWSSYAAETEGIVIAYTSVYGHTKKAVETLADKLQRRMSEGCSA